MSEFFASDDVRATVVGLLILMLADGALRLINKVVA